MTINSKTYISLNDFEFESLRSVSHEALALYLLYKVKANFRTGQLGTFFRQKLNYAGFARELSRPASQGKAARVFDTTDVKRLTDQLESVGLVEAVGWDGERLTMKLPYSPLWKGNEPQAAKPPVAEPGAAEQPAAMPSAEAMLPREDDQSDGLWTCFDGASAALPSSPSVLTSERGSTPFITTVTTDGGGTATAAATSKKAANPAASKLPDGPFKQIEEQFEKIIEKAGGLMTETTISRRYYTAWATAGVSARDVTFAVQELIGEGQPFRPGEVNSKLFPSKMAIREERQRKARSGVAL